MQNEWQEYFGYWQNQFIHHNILMLGYTAWDGYINQGKGMVVCNFVDAILPSTDWSTDTVTFDRTFVPQAQAEQYLQVLELKNDAVTALLNAIATYDPTQAIVILIVGNGEIDINLLQQLVISPANCYEQVQQRWAEFQIDLTTQKWLS